MNAPRLHPGEITRLLAEAEQHIRAGRMAEAEQAARRVLAQAPSNPLATHYLGAVAFATGHFEPGVQLLRRATELQPDVAAYWGSLGEALMRVGREVDAVEAYRRAIALDPRSAKYHFTLGSLTGKLGLIDESIRMLSRAIELKPDLIGAHNDLGVTLASARRIDDALESFRRAGAIDPGYPSAPDNILYFMNFQQGVDGLRIRAEAEAWARQYAEPLPRVDVPPRDRTPDRKLRLGYVSGAFYEHPVGRFMQPILAQRDRDAYEVFCYSDFDRDDAVARELRGAADHWLESGGLSDEALAQRVADDRIDLLVDLALHMGPNRLRMSARKPAPVQATYLGYAGTSGMSAMDWRISDPYLDPPDNDRFYTERTWRLARSYWCYQPPPQAVELGEVRPRDPADPITFACLNNIMKISDAALEAWARVLAEVPNSRMVIQGEAGEHLRVMSAFFERAGVTESRVEFWPKRSMSEYFRLHQHIDIALDSFPYAGGTTTCDALFMGVPVVTLAGETAVQRGGASILSNLGLADLIATSREQYIAIAVELARDLNRLTSLRRELRPRMQASILMKPAEFVRDLENAYRTMWRDWCGR